jgi:DNA-binding NarL/FixJ family response regulator
MDKAIRVLVANRPRLMRELILETLADQPGIEVVGEVTDQVEISDRVNQTLPDFLVIALDEPGRRPDICETILRAHPEVRILAVASGQNRTICYWASFDIHSDDIEPSEAGILNALRNITAGVGGVS